MDNVNLNQGEFLISKCDSPIQSFIKKGVSNFFDELSQYINENNDPEIFHYANEMTMASLFVSGNLKRNPTLTGVQEYGTICTREGKEIAGRPDIFMKYEKNAIWIECKFERNLAPLGDEHWNIPAWLEWDSKNAFSQVETHANVTKR